jgi:hypothetical protein
VALATNTDFGSLLTRLADSWDGIIRVRIAPAPVGQVPRVGELYARADGFFIGRVERVIPLTDPDDWFAEVGGYELLLREPWNATQKRRMAWMEDPMFPTLSAA